MVITIEVLAYSTIVILSPYINVSNQHNLSLYNIVSQIIVIKKWANVGIYLANFKEIKGIWMEFVTIKL